MATMKIGYSVKGDCVSRTITLPDGRVRRTMFKAQSLAEGTMDADAAYDLAWLTSKNMPRPRNLRNEFRAVDLFCGCGGLTLGVREAAFALGRGFRSVITY